VPHCVFSALTALGEVQGGKVSILRRGGASLGGQPLHASHRRGPGRLSPSRILGPCKPLKKPRSSMCPSPPWHHLPLRGLNQPTLTPTPRGSHPNSHTASTHPLPGLRRHPGVLDAELEDMVLQTGLQTVGGGAAAAHIFPVAA